MLEKFYSHPLKNLNTFGFDVSARCLIRAYSVPEILQLRSDRDFACGKRLVLGGGSNLLFTSDFDGCILQPLLQNISPEDDTDARVRLRVGAGVAWDELVSRCVERGWHGLENLSLIPGTVGACPVQNIGAYGAEAKDVIEGVEYVDLDSFTVKYLSNEQCRFGYRSSIFKKELKDKAVITQVLFGLSKQPRYNTSYGSLSEMVKQLGGESLHNIRRAVVATRRGKLPDPAEMGNAGSFFKNPFVEKSAAEELRKRHPDMPSFASGSGVKIPAGWLIEQCGLKGARRGSVGVHPKQALVLVSYGGGTGGEVLALAREVCQAVRDKFGVALELEVNVV
ncbi:MAG: UDP-N-acetylmuramate dehydrogenase [Prevotellaceae bacterium]|jgi:UDP-N-acetylmuramate dehydrogenase|nr:UDP-N-acetylmuramate dehydrogenase [Prevotellaceae bacterium]